MKDLPTEKVEGLKVVSVPPLKMREDVAIFSSKHSGKIISLRDLPDGSVIGSSSLRRIHTLKRFFGDKNFEIRNIRGNLNTRMKKLEEEGFDAIILAAAGVLRLGWEDKIGERLSFFEYAPAQGALALECREDDSLTAQVLGLIHDQTA